MQRDLDKLEAWAEKWQMRFNTNNCKVMHMGRENPCHQYFINSKALGKAEMIRDLRILVDSKLNWSSQCQGK